ncbi:hypothetical protein [Nostoc flagelliforme]|uniref:hypothetical protein n=1 Tax=Nostoc flagelliforme TaxID=1306274 RepID=UPI0016849157|nr:hypothetical protein [Nostoc flagelliforme]
MSEKVNQFVSGDRKCCSYCLPDAIASSYSYNEPKAIRKASRREVASRRVKRKEKKINYFLILPLTDAFKPLQPLRGCFKSRSELKIMPVA